MPPLLVDFIHARACKPFCENSLTLPGSAPLHPYIHRKDDDHNAKDSFVFNLLDTEIFEKVV